LFINYGDTEAFYAMQAIQNLRAAGIKVELYPENVKVASNFSMLLIKYSFCLCYRLVKQIASNSILLKLASEQVLVVKKFKGLCMRFV
jgi:histidyl-tRNA synthetase